MRAYMSVPVRGAYTNYAATAPTDGARRLEQRSRRRRRCSEGAGLLCRCRSGVHAAGSIPGGQEGHHTPDPTIEKFWEREREADRTKEAERRADNADSSLQSSGAVHPSRYSNAQPLRSWGCIVTAGQNSQRRPDVSPFNHHHPQPNDVVPDSPSSSLVS